MKIRLGTRQSPLALWQANYVSGLLAANGHEVELVRITTEGDVSTTPLGASGGVGVFTKEIQRALLDGRCDLAVHSLKDLPTEVIPGLQLSAVPPREVVSDALLTRHGSRVEDLPARARVGTGSPRRRAQLLRLRSDLDVVDVRGNVESRIQKMESGQYDAILLAGAGLHRLGLESRIGYTFSLDELLPAVGQAALGLETRSDALDTIEAVAALTHSETHFCVTVERELLRSMRAGCLAPLAAHSFVTTSSVEFRVRVFSSDGSEMIERNWSWELPNGFEIETARSLGSMAARELSDAGAQRLIGRA